jgi:hypothetical protein
MEGKRDREEAENDRMSNLPDFVLLHIMRYMNTKQAVQTCVLSTRWKDLWRQLTNLALSYSDFTNGHSKYRRFLFSFLSHRDDSISLLDITLRNTSSIGLEPKLMDRVMTYVVAHNVQNFTLHFNLRVKHGYTFNPCIFSCHSLTHLNLSFWSVPQSIQLPSSMQLPALKSLHLGYVTFAANDKGIVDTFRDCHMLSTLVLNCCAVGRKAKILCISNSKLSNLRINMFQDFNYKIVLSTPYLKSLTLWCDLLPEVSACDISFLEEVNIDVLYFKSSAERIYSALIIWLQVLADYVKILTLSSGALKVITCVFFSIMILILFIKCSLCLLCQYSISPLKSVL